MKKAMLICATALGLGLAGPAMADDKTIGAVIGGTAGGAVGYQLGGEGGAAIGAILGAVIGAEVADEDDRRRGYDHRHYRNDNRYYGDHRHYDNRHVRRGPPPHAAAWGQRPPARVVYVDNHRRWYGDDRRHRDDRYWRDDRHHHDRHCRH
jgi:hypothetical protein